MYQNATAQRDHAGQDRFLGSLDEDYYNAFLRELVWDSQLPEVPTDEPMDADQRHA